MDFAAFCAFCAAWEQRHRPAATRYFFQVAPRLAGRGPPHRSPAAAERTAPAAPPARPPARPHPPPCPTHPPARLPLLWQVLDARGCGYLTQVGWAGRSIRWAAGQRAAC